MKKRIIRFYKGYKGTIPNHHQPWNIQIVTHIQSPGVEISELWVSSTSNFSGTFEECKKEMCARFDAITQTGYKQEYYWDKNIKIK